MKKYKQLTLFQRDQIQALLQAGLNLTAIAENIGVSKSTISRELRRNTHPRGRTAKRLAKENERRVSHETIYKWMWKAKHSSHREHLPFGAFTNTCAIMAEDKKEPTLRTTVGPF